MSINKVILVGRLGRDPQMGGLPDGTPLCRLSLATSERWKNKNGEEQTRTEWHLVVLYGTMANIANQYLKKGYQTYVEGKIQTRRYMGRDGTEKIAFEIIGTHLNLLENRDKLPMSNVAVPEKSEGALSEIPF